MFKKKSFIFKNLSLSITLIVLIGLLITAASFLLLTNTLKSETTQEASSLASKWGKKLDLALVEEAAQSNDYSTPSQQELTKSFDTISEYNPKVAQAYIFSTELIDGNQTPIVSVPSHLVEPLKSEGLNPGDPYPQPKHIVKGIQNMLSEGKMVSTSIYQDDIGTWITELYPLKNREGKIYAYFGVDLDASMVAEGQSQIIKTSLSILLPGLLIAIILQIFMTRRSFKPLNELMSGLTEVSSGNFNLQLKHTGDDELGTINKRFNEMVTDIKTMVLKVKASSDNIKHSSQMLAETASSTDSKSLKIADVTENMSSAAKTQEESISNTSIAIEEVAKAIQSIAYNSSEVSAASQHMNKITIDGNESVKTLARQMDKISERFSLTTKSVAALKERSMEIDKLLGIITGIADQTNLLALNAAIEAARAGEAGKGFSVVASEVRKLAEESNQSARVISELVKEIQTETQNTVSHVEIGNTEISKGIEYVNLTGSLFHQIQENSNEVSANILDVSASSQQISAGTEEITATAEDLKHSAVQNSDFAGEISKIAGENQESVSQLRKSSEGLNNLADELEGLVKTFKTS
ncbi:methyl-accepting chemotaxis protein [Bacillus sp. FJAT-42376]|uniref:methyl-accepting chemotaxis protein n=1 Tax=Bacillus sp. FJAT-42376 TaxID=2014076 RepID=UPI0013DE281D|nr:methyl-accepting chemotaxis protein [Bacillus sp. FJAT-42376]